jgi:hypothetical protein
MPYPQGLDYLLSTPFPHENLLVALDFFHIQNGTLYFHTLLYFYTLLRFCLFIIFCSKLRVYLHISGLAKDSSTFL